MSSRSLSVVLFYNTACCTVIFSGCETDISSHYESNNSVSLDGNDYINDYLKRDLDNLSPITVI